MPLLVGRGTTEPGGGDHTNNSPWDRTHIDVAVAGVSAMPSYARIFTTNWRTQTIPEELYRGV